MLYIKKLFPLFIILFFFSSCTNKAIDFNNNLVNIQKGVLKEVKDFEKKLKEVDRDSLPSSNVKTSADKLVLFISNKINEARNLAEPEDGKNLKQAILEQLQFEKEIVYKIGRLMEPNIPQDEKAQIEKELLNSREKATALEANVGAAQDTFAQKSKFKLEK